MELRQLRYFEAVARHLHFTRAAQELLVAQPALSLQIQRLESELGAPLFERSTRSVRLTDAGEALLPSARRVIAEADDVRRRLRDLTRLDAGQVSIGAQQSLNASGALPRVLLEFRTRYPGVDVVLREDSAEQSLAMLSAGALDMSLTMLDSHTPAPPDVTSEPLYDEEIVFVAGPEHPMVGVPGRLTDLMMERFIAFNETAGLRRLLVRACADAGFEPRIAYESGALGSIRALAAEGLGVALLPLPSVIAPGPRVAVLDTGTALRRRISLVQPVHRYHSAAARALASLLRERLTPISA
jgi:DNA-binding transcriptional LysR family regulator